MENKPHDLGLVERRYFQTKALELAEELGMGMKEGKLTRRDGWLNVIQHELKEAVGVGVLGELLGLSTEEIEQLERAAALHDWDKRRDIKPKDFENEMPTETIVEQIDPAVRHIMQGTKERYILTELAQGRGDFLQNLLFYVDNMTAETAILPWPQRLDREEEKRPDATMAKVLGSLLPPGVSYWQTERRIMEQLDRELEQRLGKNGYIKPNGVETATFIAHLINQKIEEVIRRDVELLNLKTIMIEVRDQRRGDDPELSEDRSSVIEDENWLSATVVDGASTFGQKINGKTTGQIAAETATKTHNTFGASKDPLSALLEMNTALSEKARLLTEALTGEGGETFLKTLDLFGAAAVAIRLNKKTGVLRYAAIGDCRLVVQRPDGRIHHYVLDKVTPYEAQEISLVQRLCHEKGLTPQEAFSDPESQALITHNHHEVENRPDGTGYGMLKGITSNEVLEKYIETGMIQLEPGCKVYLMTDGMLPPAEENEQNPGQVKELQRRMLMNLALKKGGIAELLRATRELEEADHDLKNPRLKTHDDACGLEIEVVLS